MCAGSRVPVPQNQLGNWVKESGGQLSSVMPELHLTIASLRWLGTVCIGPHMAAFLQTVHHVEYPGANKPLVQY